MLRNRNRQLQDTRVADEHMYARQFFAVGGKKSRPVFAYARCSPRRFAGIDEQLELAFAINRRQNFIERRSAEISGVVAGNGDEQNAGASSLVKKSRIAGREMHVAARQNFSFNFGRRHVSSA